MEYIKQCINNIDETTKEGLSNVTNELGNKIILFYDNLTELINQQRCVNLQLQLEINNLNKEKNSMRNEFRTLVTSVKKLETVLGVEVDAKFESMVTHTIYN
jgi:DNA replication protein DnaD